MRYHYEKPNIYFTMYGKHIYAAIIRCMTVVRYI